jgi:hypothetical protein
MNARDTTPPMLEALEGRVEWVSSVVPGMSIVRVRPGLARLAEIVLRTDPCVTEVLPNTRGFSSAVPNDSLYVSQTSIRRVCAESA